MSKILKLSARDMLTHIKISCQIPEILQAIATRFLIVGTTEELGIEISAQELQQAADSLRFAHKLLKADDTWRWLQKHYLSLDEFEEIARINLLSAKLAEYLFANKVEPFFYENLLNYAGAITYEILLDDEDIALELYYALLENEATFAHIARQYIQEPELRRAGGYRGIRHRSDFRPEIAAAVFAAHPPQIIKPIVTQQGVHLVMVEEIIQPQLTEQLRMKIIGDLFSAWLKQQLEEIEIIAEVEFGIDIEPAQKLSAVTKSDY